MSLQPYLAKKEAGKKNRHNRELSETSKSFMHEKIPSGY